MISSINNTNPSFRGMYIVKGPAKDVSTVIQHVHEHCGSIEKRMRDKVHGNIVEYFPDYHSYEQLALTPVYGENQPLAQILIGTNEHTKNIDNWYKIMDAPIIDKLRQKIEEIEVRQTPYGTVISCDFMGLLKELKRMKKEFMAERELYLDAEAEAKKGNMDLMADFLIDIMQTAKRRLQEVRDLATVSYKEPKTLEATDVLQAIKERTFNFITGDIK